MRFGEVWAWPLIVVGAFIVFGGRLKTLVDVLLRRIERAQRLKIAGFWQDDLGRGFESLLRSTFRSQWSLSSDDARTTSRSTTSAYSTHGIPEERVEPASPGETVRETLVRVIAASAARAFVLWRLETNRRFPDDKMALLAWIADVGAPQVMRSYDVFVAVAQRVADRYQTVPPPDRTQFEAQVAAFNRDHPAE
jgi:hypothetical protein